MPCHQSAISSRTSSGCGARWTSCSATSSATSGSPRGAPASAPPSTSSTPTTPPRAIVHAELAGIDAGDLGLEIQGRSLTLTGHRREADAEGRVYQQLEIEHGPFRRTIELGAEVVAEQARATYQDGILRVELPLADPQARTRTVPIQRGGPAEPTEIEES